MQKIKAIILDVDGVIVGGIAGLTAPDPHPKIIKKLKQVSKQGIVVSLCTAKGLFAVEKIIRDAKLNNLHVVDGGGIIYDAAKKKAAIQHAFKKDVAQNLISNLIDQKIYLELYTLKNYYIQKEFFCNKTKQHAKILQMQPKKVDSILNICDKYDVAKMTALANTDNEKEKINKLFSQFSKELDLNWFINPQTPGLNFGVITKKGVSKKQGIIDLSNELGIAFENMLGVGDGISDWEFMEMCKYAATLDNASEQVKNLIKTKKENSFIGPHVDENGLLEILDYYLV